MIPLSPRHAPVRPVHPYQPMSEIPKFARRCARPDTHTPQYKHTDPSTPHCSLPLARTLVGVGIVESHGLCAEFSIALLSRPLAHNLHLRVVITATGWGVARRSRSLHIAVVAIAARAAVLAAATLATLTLALAAAVVAAMRALTFTRFRRLSPGQLRLRFPACLLYTSPSPRDS